MKKKIPLGLRKILDDVNSQNDNLFSVEFGNDFIVKFNDNDNSSDFSFQVTKINSPEDNKHSYSIKYKPYCEQTLDSRTTSITLENFRSHFLLWKRLLVESNLESPLFDDIITQNYYDELEPKFEIIDEDANYNSFSISQQKRILEFLDVANKIIKAQEDNEVEKVDIINLIEETKKSISKTTKNEVVKNIRRIIAKGFKMGLLIGEKLLIEFTTELAKKLITGN
jgi:hypothetical protein